MHALRRDRGRMSVAALRNRHHALGRWPDARALTCWAQRGIHPSETAWQPVLERQTKCVASEPHWRLSSAVHTRVGT